jgi:hypothetical protein
MRDGSQRSPDKRNQRRLHFDFDPHPHPKGVALWQSGSAWVTLGLSSSSKNQEAAQASGAAGRAQIKRGLRMPGQKTELPDGLRLSPFCLLRAKTRAGTGCVKTHPLLDGDSKRLPRDTWGTQVTVRTGLYRRRMLSILPAFARAVWLLDS